MGRNGNEGSNGNNNNHNQNGGGSDNSSTIVLFAGISMVCVLSTCAYVIYNQHTRSKAAEQLRR